MSLTEKLKQLSLSLSWSLTKNQLQGKQTPPLTPSRLYFSTFLLVSSTHPVKLLSFSIPLCFAKLSAALCFVNDC